MEIKELIKEAHENAVNKGFWEIENKAIKAVHYDPKYSFEVVEAIGHAFISQKLMLIVSEVSEALEAMRKNDVNNFNEEIADIVIRIGDLCGGMGIDLEQEIINKMNKNKERPKLHGKLF